MDKEDFSSQVYEVSAIHYDTAVIVLPDFVTHNGINYVVTNAIQWYNPQNCSLHHYDKIDMSEAKHITWLSTQISALIAIDTLILPPNLQRFPMNCYTSDTISWRNQLMDEENLLPGIHRVYSTATQADEFVELASCTSLIEADLSSYTTTNRSNVGGHDFQFSQNPFLTKLVLPNTIKVFYDGVFSADIRLIDVNIPDSLEQIRGRTTVGLPIDTLRLGKKIYEISNVFANSWYALKHIKVDSGNLWFMDDHGVLYTKNQHWLWRYPYTRSGSELVIPAQTDSLAMFAFALSWPRFDITTVEQYTRLIKQLADSASLRKVVCHPALKFLGYEGTFSGSCVRTMSKECYTSL